LYWEIQLIHNELVDQELIGKVHKLKIQDFLEREKNIPKLEIGPIGTLPPKRKNLAQSNFMTHIVCAN
jgi:hypothetical protein